MKKAANALGLPESAIFRGADSKLPDWRDEYKAVTNE